MNFSNSGTRGRIRSHLAGACAALLWGAVQPVAADPLACVEPSRSPSLFALSCPAAYLVAYVLARGWLAWRAGAARAPLPALQASHPLRRSSHAGQLPQP